MHIQLNEKLIRRSYSGLGNKPFGTFCKSIGVFC